MISNARFPSKGTSWATDAADSKTGFEMEKHWSENGKSIGGAIATPSVSIETTESGARLDGEPTKSERFETHIVAGWEASGPEKSMVGRFSLLEFFKTIAGSDTTGCATRVSCFFGIKNSCWSNATGVGDESSSKRGLFKKLVSKKTVKPSEEFKTGIAPSTGSSDCSGETNWNNKLPDNEKPSESKSGFNAKREKSVEVPKTNWETKGGETSCSNPPMASLAWMFPCTCKGFSGKTGTAKPNWAFTKTVFSLNSKTCSDACSNISRCCSKGNSPKLFGNSKNRACAFLDCAPSNKTGLLKTHFPVSSNTFKKTGTTGRFSGFRILTVGHISIHGTSWLYESSTVSELSGLTQTISPEYVPGVAVDGKRAQSKTDWVCASRPLLSRRNEALGGTVSSDFFCSAGLVKEFQNFNAELTDWGIKENKSVFDAGSGSPKSTETRKGDCAKTVDNNKSTPSKNK